VSSVSPGAWLPGNSGHRPYSEQRHDRYESEAVRGRLSLSVFSMASAVKSGTSS